MGDLYSTYSLPPPPPPTILSFYRGPDRARLPNFLESDQPVEAARKWLHDLIMFVCVPSIWTNVKVVTGIASCILISAIAVIVRRLFQRSMWFLRLKQTERGPLVVPNAIMIFAGAEGLFAILFLTLINKVYVAWEIEKEPLPNLIFWICLTWSPLIAGPIWSSFGVWHARPPSTQPQVRGKVSNNTDICGFAIPLPKPLVSSFFFLLIPFGQLLSVFGPAYIGNTHREEAARMYRQWNEQYRNATVLTRPMLLDLQNIWRDELQAFYWLAVSMFVWFAWCVLLFIVYVSVNLRLLLPLRAQLKTLRERNAKRVIAALQSSPVHKVTDTNSYFEAQAKSQIESIKLPLETPRLRSLAINFVGSRIQNSDYQQAEDDLNIVDQHWGLNADDIKKDQPNTSFFPPVKPSAVVRAAPDSETSEKYLSAAYKHFLFQAVTISIAIVYFSEITLWLALSAYTFHERDKIGVTIDVAFLQAMWGAVVFGSLVFVSITMRTYEPMLVNLLQSSQGGDGAQRSQTTSKNSDGRSHRLSKLSASPRSPQTSGERRLGALSTASTPSSKHSPVPPSKSHSMAPLHELLSDKSEPGRRPWQSEAESWTMVNSRSPKSARQKDMDTTSDSMSQTHTHVSNQSTSSRSRAPLRRADIVASARAPEYSLPLTPPEAQELALQPRPPPRPQRPGDLERRPSRPSRPSGRAGSGLGMPGEHEYGIGIQLGPTTPLSSSDSSAAAPEHQARTPRRRPHHPPHQQEPAYLTYLGGLSLPDSSTSSLGDDSLREISSAHNLASSSEGIDGLVDDRRARGGGGGGNK